ncbi:MAG: NAD(P)H-dependent oxidoreductase [Cyanobacteria bacterium P01_H01_bin.74]
MKLLAFAATNHMESINKQLLAFVGTQLKQTATFPVVLTMLDLIDFEMPLYRQDREAQTGIPEQAKLFYRHIGEADALMISLAEHNGFYPAFYKNLFDWTSRISQKVYQDKPALLLSTSPGQGGAGNVLKTAIGSAPYFGMDVKASVSVPSFFDNFNPETQSITNPDIQIEIDKAIKLFLETATVLVSSP